jgi:hypothetical protein
MHRYADLPTPRAKEKARAELAQLEARIEVMERQQEDTSEAVEQHYDEMLDLRQASADARLAMSSEAGERALRQRAEALRGVIHGIECTFTATGLAKGGRGRKNTRLAEVTIYPVVGDARHFFVGARNNEFRATRATSHM